VSVELSDQATEEVCSFVVRIQKKYINSKCIMIIINVFLEFQLPEEEIPAAQVINCDQPAFISLISSLHLCCILFAAICRDQNGKAVLCGVTSFGGDDKDCRDNQNADNCPPSIYASVPYFYDWIQRNAGKENDLLTTYHFFSDNAFQILILNRKCNRSPEHWTNYVPRCHLAG
jgi:hypothetical protein